MLLRQVEDRTHSISNFRKGENMACYHPKLRIEMIGKWEKAQDGHLYHPAIIIPADKENETLEKITDWSANYKKTIIPCRKCIGCKLDYSRDWANRGYLESKKSDNNHFITLTYNDENLPMLDEITTENGITYTKTDDWKGVLVPDHLTKFIHDIRQYFYRKNGLKNTKYLACGEYGTENGRPHYHIIFFGLPLNAEDFYNTKIIDKNYFSQHKLIEKYWDRGFSYVSTATWNTIAYVSRYVTKKLYGNNADDERAQKGQIPEFIRMSKGIAKEYWEKNKDSILKTDSITIRNAKGVHQTKPPRYFYRLLEKEDREMYQEIKNRHIEQNKHAQKVKDTQHTYGRLGELENQERTKQTQAGTLKRTL